LARRSVDLERESIVVAQGSIALEWMGLGWTGSSKIIGLCFFFGLVLGFGPQTQKPLA